MKRLLTLILGLGLCAAAFGQAKIVTKKEKLSDFTMKTTKIVLSGNDFLDEPLRDAAKSAWTISPYEFCSMDEFASLRGSDTYYFLVPVTVRQKGESAAGLTFLTLVKGGGKSLDQLLEVVSFPLCAADFPSGRESAYLPAILDIIQTYVDNSLVSGFHSVGASGHLSKAKGKQLHICRADLAPGLEGKVRGRNVCLSDEDEVGELLSEGAAETLVTYTVVPELPSKGSLCYVMVLDTRSHELYYYKRHKVSGEQRKGILSGELGKILSGR